jgi:glycosyltransferase involved in cell wall biosynthesis
VKLTLVTETFPPEVNGVAMTLQRIAYGLAARGHAVDVVRPRLKSVEPSGLPPGLRQCFVPSLPLPFYTDLRLGLPAGRRLRRRWKEAPPDVVHVATEGPLGWSALLAARRLGIPVSTSFHTNFHQYLQRYLFHAIFGVTLSYLRNFHNRAACTLAPTDQTRAELMAQGFERVGVLTRGVDTRLFSPARRNAELRGEWGVSADDPVFVYVGRLAVEKNVELAVAAFLQAQAVEPRAHFVLVGDGPKRKAMAAAYPGFHFVGMRHGEDLAAHYASADVFLFPSTTETFGNVVTEGLASGLVVVSFDYAAGRQYIVSGRNGLLVPFGDTAAFRQAGGEIMQRRAEWPAMRTAARAIAETITWERVFESFERTLTGVRDGQPVAGAAADRVVGAINR